LPAPAWTTDCPRQRNIPDELHEPQGLGSLPRGKPHGQPPSRKALWRSGDALRASPAGSPSPCGDRHRRHPRCRALTANVEWTHSSTPLYSVQHAGLRTARRLTRPWSGLPRGLDSSAQEDRAEFRRAWRGLLHGVLSRWVPCTHHAPLTQAVPKNR
jgi:hypothetical protein